MSLMVRRFFHVRTELSSNRPVFEAGELRPNFSVFHDVSYLLGGVFPCFSHPWCVLRHLEGIPSELHHLLSQEPPSIVHLHLTTVQVIGMQVELFDADPVVWVPHHFLEGGI